VTVNGILFLGKKINKKIKVEKFKKEMLKYLVDFFAKTIFLD
jgi:hypothetical protein